MGEENERLRRENARLTRELGHMKKLCNNILLLMSKYAATQHQDGSAGISSVVNCSGESSEADWPEHGADVKPEAADPHPGGGSSSKEASPDQNTWPIYRPTPVYHSVRPACDRAGSDQDGSSSR
uniref:Uncharacterized protein n=1 Tax=Oryza brachyantha TaxID=4533 RepID=J3MZE0_ORYBR